MSGQARGDFRFRSAATALVLGGTLGAPWSAVACPGLDPCAIPGGGYYALPPPGWNGDTPLPTMIFFHGYGMKALELAQDPDFTRPFAMAGVLLVLPDSLGPGWGRDRPTPRGRDEIAFSDALRADLVHRFHADPGRLLASGFSAGGILTLELACRRGGGYAGFVVIAGTFREPLPASCPTGPVDLLQIHGLADTVVPIDGTPPDDPIRLVGVEDGLATLRALDGCGSAPDRTTDGPSGQRCSVWDRCTSGRELRLCLHPGGHLVPEGWVAQAQAWLRGLKGVTRTAR
ncbi:alpha/beta hydrolase family esterase [Benzoatithermus flavus]|uniref:Polyhydroxybutyrate depolymerase n=1 Tax=Benzoatithermus flavus TaxID=3108223 RepID=A0ABU8XRS1_9PROT